MLSQMPDLPNRFNSTFTCTTTTGRGSVNISLTFICAFNLHIFQDAKSLGRATKAPYCLKTCAKYAIPCYEFVVFLQRMCKIRASRLRIYSFPSTIVQNAAGLLQGVRKFKKARITCRKCFASRGVGKAVSRQRPSRLRTPH